MQSRIALLLIVALVHQASAACPLDGHNTAQIAQNDFSLAPSQTITLTTTSPNDVVIIHSQANVRGPQAVSLASITGGGLTFTRRFIETQSVPDAGGAGNTRYYDVETWWAQAPNPLSGATFTVTYNAPAQTTFVNIFAYAFSGLANPGLPWDSNGSLPAKGTNYTGKNPGTPSVIQVAGVSTSNANDVLLWHCFVDVVTGGSPASSCSWGALAPWTDIDTLYQQNIFSGFFDNSADAYQPILATQSGATLTALNPAVAIQPDWIANVDALVCVASPVGGAVFPHIGVHE